MNVTVIHPGDIDNGDRVREHNPKRYDQLVLAEGDSWFSVGGVPAGNILYALNFPKSTLVVNIADPGHKLVENIGDPARMEELRRLVAEKKDAYKWKFILLSGGGNDLIGGAENLLKKNNPPSTVAADYIDADKLNDLMERVQAHFRSIVEMRDSTDYNRNTPIFTHTYDYPTPRNAPARVLGAGVGDAWLSKAFANAGIPQSMWRDVSDDLLKRLATAILELDCRHSPDSVPTPLTEFYVIDTCNTLERADPDTDGSSKDWLNEIHPGISGNRKLAGKLCAEIQRLLAERQAGVAAAA